MNNNVVMTAINERMSWIYEKVICNPANKGKDLSKWKDEIKDLHDAYMELRGHSGSVAYVQGVDTQINNVTSIYALTMEG